MSDVPLYMETWIMKKSVLFGFICCLLASVCLTNCGKKGLQNVRGEVRSLEVHGDTLVAMSLNIGKDTMLFSLDDARFQNGLMLPRDSVIVDYIEGYNVLRALVVTVIPKAKQYDNHAKSDTLITAPTQ